MTIAHHPHEALLLDYSTGALTEGWSLAVASHLALCPACRQTAADLDALGGSLLELAAPKAVVGPDISAVMAQLGDSPPDAGEKVRQTVHPGRPVLPEPLRSYVGGDVSDAKWQRLGLGAYQAAIPLEGASEVARLLRIPAGRPVPEHTHRGQELTLVLAGAFDDVTGHYARGDLQDADETLAHQPHAAPGMDCICLAVTDAPLRFSNFAARLVQPFLGI